VRLGALLREYRHRAHIEDGLVAGSDDWNIRSPSPRDGLVGRVRELISAIREDDEARVEQAILDLSRSHRIFAPLAFVVGAFAMLFDGVKLLVSNRRLAWVQMLPAMWIWLAMCDLKWDLFKKESFTGLRGPVLVPVILAVTATTAAAFFLNATFGFAIARRGPPEIRPAFREARSHLGVILMWGLPIGLALGVSAIVLPRWRWWFLVSLGIVVGVMMFAYVAVPSQLAGIRTSFSRRDKLEATAIGGAIGGTVCAPPYLLGRLGLLMLGIGVLLIPGVLVFALAVVLQAAATGAVKAIKMSAKLMAGRQGDDGVPGPLNEGTRGRPDARPKPRSPRTG
jgi:hypothetical protein